MQKKKSFSNRLNWDRTKKRVKSLFRKESEEWIPTVTVTRVRRRSIRASQLSMLNIQLIPMVMVQKEEAVVVLKPSSGQTVLLNWILLRQRLKLELKKEQIPKRSKWHHRHSSQDWDANQVSTTQSSIHTWPGTGWGRIRSKHIQQGLTVALYNTNNHCNNTNNRNNKKSSLIMSGKQVLKWFQVGFSTKTSLKSFQLSVWNFSAWNFLISFLHFGNEMISKLSQLQKSQNIYRDEVR